MLSLAFRKKKKGSNYTLAGFYVARANGVRINVAMSSGVE